MNNGCHLFLLTAMGLKHPLFNNYPSIIPPSLIPEPGQAREDGGGQARERGGLEGKREERDGRNKEK